MTSCPDEADVVLLLDDTADATDAADATGPKAEAVIAHLAECEACRLLLARSEASLRAALGGLADAAAVAVTTADDGRSDDAPRPHPRLLALRRFAAAAAVVAAAFAGWAFARRDAATPALGRETANVPDRETATAPESPRAGAPTTTAPRTLEEEMRQLLAEATRLAEAPAAGEQSDEIALAALAAAEARIDLGVPTGVARLRDVVERFPGTPEAREARARLASLGETR